MARLPSGTPIEQAQPWLPIRVRVYGQAPRTSPPRPWIKAVTMRHCVFLNGATRSPMSKRNVNAEAKKAEEIEERTAPPGVVVYQAIYGEAEHELARDNGGLAWSGLAAGLSMGFSMLAQALLQMHLGDNAAAPLISPLGYTVGFLIVILGRQQLFTENTLTPILPLLKTMKWSVLWNVARLWAIVLATNLIGGFLLPTLLGNTIGGVALVAALAHAQFMAGGRGKQARKKTV
jgi:hypothetical protein